MAASDKQQDEDTQDSVTTRAQWLQPLRFVIRNFTIYEFHCHWTIQIALINEKSFVKLRKSSVQYTRLA